MTPAVVNLDANAAKHRAARAATCLATEPAATPANGTAAASKKRHATNGDRWAMLNAFVDVIAPRLTLVERAVWLVMFRHTRGGTCDTSERAIATQARIDKASAGKALRRLVELGLAWPVFKSNSKGTSSRYGLHPRPDACVAAVIAADDARRKEAQERREERGGDRRGKRRKPR